MHLLRYLHGAAFALGLVLFGALPAFAQKAPVEAEKITAVKEMYAAMGADKQFDTVIRAMLQGMTQSYKQQRPSAAKEIDDVMSRMQDKFLSRKNEAVELSAPLYAEAFSLDEIKAITAFYRSDIGQKLVKEQPAIMQKSIQLGMAWGQRIGQEVEQEARQELKRRGIDL